MEAYNELTPYFVSRFFLTKRKPTQELFLELFYSPYPNNITFQKNIVFSFLFTFFSSPSHLFAVN